MFRSFVAAAVAVSMVTACGGLDHQNPYDPETPPGNQAKATLAGDVTLEAGTVAPSLSGVHVSIPGTSLSADTDAAGHYAIAGVSPGTWAVQAVRSGWDDALITGIAVTLDDGGHEVAVPSLGLKRAKGTVSGKVALNDLLGGGSGPLGGASVSLAGLPGAVTTDDAGGFLLDGVPVGTYTVSASKIGFLSGTVASIDVTPNGVTDVGEVPVQWDPGGVSGALLVQGAAASGGVTVRVAGVTLIGTPFQATTTSAPDGTWGLEGLVPAGTYNVSFELADYAVVATTASVAPHATTAVPAVTLVRDTGGVTGVATLQNASDSSGVQVALTPLPTAADPSPAPAAAALTDASGIWRVDALPVGTYTVSYKKTPGYLAQAGSATIVSHAVVAAAPVVLPAIPGVLRGKCLLEGAAAGALAGTTVRVEGTNLSTATLADGSWVLSGVGSGAQVVVFERTAFDAQRAQVVTAPGDDVTLFDVTLATSRGAIGGAFALQGLAASAGVVVTATGPATASTVTDATGVFMLPGLPVGSYTVTAHKDPDWQPDTVTGVVVPAAGTVQVAGSPRLLAPVATAAVSGVALLEQQANASGTTVTLAGTDFRGVAVSTTTGTSAAGAFSFAGLRSGSYQVAFAHAGFDAAPPVGISLVAGQVASVGTVTLAASRGSVAGTVTATGAASQAGTVVTVGGGPDIASAVTDAAGAFRIDRLRIGGGYAASFTRPDYASATSATFSVAAGALTTLAPAATLALATTGSIAGTAAVERGQASGIAVSLTGTDVNGAAVTRSTSTDAAGLYSFGGLPSGTYALALSKSGYEPQSIAGLAVKGAAVAAPSVTLLVATGIVAGQVALSAGTVPGFSVGSDFSGVVVTLSGTDVPVAAAVTDTAGAYRFTGVPVSLSGAQFTVTAKRPSYASSSTSVTAVADATVTVSTTLTLAVNAGSLAGTALLWDNVGNAGANATSAGVSISVSGSAFNGTSYGATPSPTSGASGAWTVAALPPGTYDVLATNANRTCGAAVTAVVAEGAAVTLSAAIRCTDAVAPGALVLGTPTAPAGAQPGYTTTATVAVPVAVAASDATLPTSNLRGYQLAVGAAPDWSAASIAAGQPASLTFALPTGAGGVPLDGTYTLWARGLDWAGNAGPTASATVVVDTAAPPTPSISTARAQVNATSAAVTLAGSDGAPNFLQYEACTGVSASPAAACSATPACVSPATPSPTVAAFSVSLTANARNCVWARARDKAGNASGYALAEIVSDLTPPTGPGLSPLFDPTALTVHADYADFFVTSPATDAPAGGSAWANVAWIEVDTGSGFSPLCPADACHAGNVYNPCTCACTDARLVCRDGALYAIRVPLLGGTANDVAVRAVDVAGNVGSGAGQSVPVAGFNFQVSTTAFDEGQPRARGKLLVYRGPPSSTGASSIRLVDLGANQRYDAADTSCEISAITATASTLPAQPVAEPLSATAVIYSDPPAVANVIKVRRAGADGSFCTGDDATTTVKSLAAGYPYVSALSASLDRAGTRERVAWAETLNGGGTAIKVRDGGADNVLGTADDVEWTIAASLPGFPSQLQLAGDTLVYGSAVGYDRAPATGLTVVNAVGGSFASGVATTWALPVTAIAAALEEGGRVLAYFGTASGTPTLHVRYPGADLSYGTGDDVDVTRTWSGPAVTDGGIAIRDAHVVLTEGSVATGGKYLDHWYAGGDGTFGTGDDTFARALPNAPGRWFPTLGTGIAGGVVYVQSGAVGSNGDVLGVDLSALRWDVAGAGTPAAGPVTNKAGTMFYSDASSTLRARTSDGRETTLLGVAANGAFAADGANLLLPSGNDVWLYRRDPATSQFFTAGAPAPVKAATLPGNAGVVAAGGGRAVVWNGGDGHLAILEPSPTLATPVQVSLEGVPAGYRSWFGGSGVSATHAVFGCMSPTFAKQVCVREAGLDGVFGTGDDRLLVLTRPSAAAYGTPLAIAVSGARVTLVADGVGGPHLYVLDAGPDKKFSTGGDDVEVDYGPIADGRGGGIDLAGNLVAWSTDAGAGSGQQIFLADFAQRTQRLLTTHYSGKPTVVLDPSGRTYWLDQVFSTSAIFVSAP